MSSEIQAVQIWNWEQLREKQRDEKEELMYQTIQKLEPAFWNGVKRIENNLYGAFCFHEGKNAQRRAISASFLISEEGFILVIIKDDAGILQDIEKEADLEAMEEGLEALFDGVLKRGQQQAEAMEEYLIAMEQEIVSGKISRNRNKSIFECKRSLTVWKNDYMQFLNIAEGINGLEQQRKEQQGQILTEEAASYFRVYENKIKRLTEEIQFLYEELVHIRETLDAALSYEQNRIMKVFTTVTTIFMPLTLIAGWYGMNFAYMPELGWRYGYVFVGILSVIVILLCIWLFKKKKLF